eukprot:gene4385-biopygen6923
MLSKTAAITDRGNDAVSEPIKMRREVLPRGGTVVIVRNGGYNPIHYNGPKPRAGPLNLPHGVNRGNWPFEQRNKHLSICQMIQIIGEPGRRAHVAGWDVCNSGRVCRPSEGLKEADACYAATSAGHAQRRVPLRSRTAIHTRSSSSGCSILEEVPQSLVLSISPTLGSGVVWCGVVRCVVWCVVWCCVARGDAVWRGVAGVHGVAVRCGVVRCVWSVECGRCFGPESTNEPAHTWLAHFAGRLAVTTLWRELTENEGVVPDAGVPGHWRGHGAYRHFFVLRGAGIARACPLTPGVFNVLMEARLQKSDRVCMHLHRLRRW